MYSDLELCETIISLYPEIGECGIDIDVDYDHSKNMWVVHLQKDTHSLDHFLEVLDADRCMDGKQCVTLGLEIGQLRKNVKGEQF